MNGLPPRSIVKDTEGEVPLCVIPTLKTGKLPNPPEQLVSTWNEVLCQASKDMPTPLREEIDFYPPSFTENNSDRRERPWDDERVSGSEFDGINNNGVRETTRELPNDINRRHQYQLKYNPLRQSRTAIERQVRNHPDFLVDAARNEIQLTNIPIVDLAEQMGVRYDWLRQRLSRGNQVLDFHENDPSGAAVRELFGIRKGPVPEGFNIAVRSNNRVEISYLGTNTDSPQQYLDALLRLQKEKTKDAVKYVRRKAQKNGWSAAGQLAAAEQAARARVEETYRPFFERFQREIEAQGERCHNFPIR